MFDYFLNITAGKCPPPAATHNRPFPAFTITFASVSDQCFDIDTTYSRCSIFLKINIITLNYDCVKNRYIERFSLNAIYFVLNQLYTLFINIKFFSLCLFRCLTILIRNNLKKCIFYV